MSDLLFEKRGRLVRALPQDSFILQKADGKYVDLTKEMKEFEGEQVVIRIERVR